MKKIISDNWPDLVIWILTIIVFIIILSGCAVKKQQDCCNKHVINEDGISWYTTNPCEKHELKN